MKNNIFRGGYSPSIQAERRQSTGIACLLSDFREGGLRRTEKSDLLSDFCQEVYS